MPVLRAQARKFRNLALDEIEMVLRSPFHEERLFALFLLVRNYEKGGERDRQAIFELYLENRRFVNNWDLVDSSSPHIIGAWLENREKAPLYTLARSENLWDRRIAIIATLKLIRSNRFDDTLRLSLLLKRDPEDLIHKAVGWMLREVGKRDAAVEKAFLDEHSAEMPRTMLRYAIERFPEHERQKYLKGLKCNGERKKSSDDG